MSSEDTFSSESVPKRRFRKLAIVNENSSNFESFRRYSISNPKVPNNVQSRKGRKMSMFSNSMGRKMSGVFSRNRAGNHIDIENFDKRKNTVLYCV